ncbi:MAG: Ribosomal small subunit pseudouridine synthase A [Betaproteobacteria bacterium ADurb.Bin341]|nr:MAG: Ribosomal small subunit pseudouridine synthase A [Betaproteobacteria bacterium ADurb.Bin341]
MFVLPGAISMKCERDHASIGAMQLERILHQQGFGNRKACRALARQQRVMVAAQICDDPFAELATEGLVFSVDGVDWSYHEKATLVLHKPAGYECSRRPLHHPSVYALLPRPLLERGVQAVGRLDEDTTGLLLFTDDGQLNHRLTSPRHQVRKTYRVHLKHPAKADFVAALLHGVKLHDEPEFVLALACSLLDEKTVQLVVGEGKYHQVKRMVAAAGNRVEALHREATGEFRLPADLAPGQWRWLGVDELKGLLA